MKRLLGLLQAGGHDDFRDTRGPMGFTQHQAAGKFTLFTRDEAATFISMLEDTGLTGDLDLTAPPPRQSATEQALRRVPAEQLAAELQRRGWVVIQP